jgi:hypothetical protein
MAATLLIGALAFKTGEPSLARRSVLRRSVLLGLPAATILAPTRAFASDLLETAGTFVNVLKPLYKLEAPLQAGDYDVRFYGIPTLPRSFA